MTWAIQEIMVGINNLKLCETPAAIVPGREIGTVFHVLVDMTID